MLHLAGGVARQFTRDDLRQVFWCGLTQLFKRSSKREHRISTKQTMLSTEGLVILFMAKKHIESLFLAFQEFLTQKIDL